MKTETTRVPYMRTETTRVPYMRTETTRVPYIKIETTSVLLLEETNILKHVHLFIFTITITARLINPRMDIG